MRTRTREGDLYKWKLEIKFVGNELCFLANCLFTERSKYPSHKVSFCVIKQICKFTCQARSVLFSFSLTNFDLDVAYCFWRLLSLLEIDQYKTKLPYLHHLWNLHCKPLLFDVMFYPCISLEWQLKWYLSVHNWESDFPRTSQEEFTEERRQIRKHCTDCKQPPQTAAWQEPRGPPCKHNHIPQVLNWNFSLSLSIYF